MHKELIATFIKFVLAEELGENSSVHKVRLDMMLAELEREERLELVNRLALVKTYITGLMRG